MHFQVVGNGISENHPTPGQLLGANSDQASELYASSLFKGEGPTYSQFQQTLTIWGYWTPYRLINSYLNYQLMRQIFRFFCLSTNKILCKFE